MEEVGNEGVGRGFYAFCLVLLDDFFMELVEHPVKEFVAIVVVIVVEKDIGLSDTGHELFYTHCASIFFVLLHVLKKILQG